MSETAGVNALSSFSCALRVALPVEVEARACVARATCSHAAGETHAVARPGGVISAFCEPATTTSSPHSSVSSGTAPRLETASTTTSAPASFAAAASDRTSATTPGRGLGMDEERPRRPARSRRDGASGRPQSASRPTRSEAPRRRSRTSAPSPPSAPRSTRRRRRGRARRASRGSTIADSNPPVPEHVKRSTSELVRWTSWSRPSTRS